MSSHINLSTGSSGEKQPGCSNFVKVTVRSTPSSSRNSTLSPEPSTAALDQRVETARAKKGKNVTHPARVMKTRASAKVASKGKNVAVAFFFECPDAGEQCS